MPKGMGPESKTLIDCQVLMQLQTCAACNRK